MGSTASAFCVLLEIARGRSSQESRCPWHCGLWYVTFPLCPVSCWSLHGFRDLGCEVKDWRSLAALRVLAASQAGQHYCRWGPVAAPRSWQDAPRSWQDAVPTGGSLEACTCSEGSQRSVRNLPGIVAPGMCVEHKDI